MALEPITRQEQIIAGKDLKPITRMERFLKEYGGGSGGSGGGAEKFVVNFETLDMQNWTCDKTLAEIIDAHTQGRDVVGSLMGQMMVDFIEVSQNGKVTFGRVFPDRTILLSYYILVADDGVEVVCASCQMTKM